MHVSECIRAKKLSYNENGKFKYILSISIRKTDYGRKVALSGWAFSQYSDLSYSTGKAGAYSLITSVSIKWIVADDVFISFIQSHS